MTTRRKLLQGLGAAALAAPFLSRTPSAHAENKPKRLFVFFTPNSFITREHWKPAGNGASFEMTSLPPMLQSLTPHLDKLTIVGDLEMKTAKMDPVFSQGHPMTGHLLTGRINKPIGQPTGATSTQFWASGESVDQFIADRIGVPGLVAGARYDAKTGRGRLSYRGADQPVQPLGDPLNLFNKIFGDFTQPPEVVDEQKRQRRAVLSAVAGNYRSLESRLPPADRTKLEMHLTLVEQLRQKLEKDSILGCDQQGVDDLQQRLGQAAFDSKANAQYPETGRRQIDVLVQALACGITNTAVMQHGTSSGYKSYPEQWIGENINTPFHEHEIAHKYAFEDPDNPSIIAARMKVEDFYCRQFAYLLEALDSVDEGDGTSLLDNTVVYWTHTFARGTHSTKEMSYVLAGAKHKLAGGRFHSFPGVPHNNMLVELCNLMGLDDVTTFGEPTACTGALSLT